MSETAGLAGPGPGGDWPRTKRVLPWMLAAFLLMLWLIPIDAVVAPVNLPVDSQLDRFMLVALIIVWLVAVATGEPGPRRVRNPLTIAVGAFLAVAGISIILNLGGLARIDELDLAIKKLSLAFSLGIFFWIAATSVRRAELPAFMTLSIVLAAIAAAGTVIEYRWDTNYFYDLTRSVAPGFTVTPEPVDPTFGRPNITGPTSHGLALAVMFAMVLPFAVVRLSQTGGRARVLYAIAAALILAGGIATLRKTAVPAFGVGLIVLTLYRPREMLRLIPLGLVLVFAIHLVVPGGMSGIRYELMGGSELSNRARTDDYPAVAPDIDAHPILGRGYGTYDPRIHVRVPTAQRHRTLDNQYLMLLVETGIVGVLVFLCLAASAMITLHRTARSGDPTRAGPAIAIIAGVAAFAVSSALFDTLAFAQVPYLFFSLLAFATVARLEPERVGFPGRVAGAGADA